MIVAFSVTPLGVGEGVSGPVARAVHVVRSSGLPNHTDAMFTTIEGDDWDEVMDVVKAAVSAVAEVAPRVSVVLPVKLQGRVTARDDILIKQNMAGCGVTTYDQVVPVNRDSPPRRFAGGA